nr:MAG TPA: hypothetical protein [Caudoviricetes sp.]
MKNVFILSHQERVAFLVHLNLPLNSRSFEHFRVPLSRHLAEI